MHATGEAATPQSLLQRARMIAPATLNKRSTLAEVVGMLRNLTDRRQSVGKSFNCIEIQNDLGTSVEW